MKSKTDRSQGTRLKLRAKPLRQSKESVVSEHPPLPLPPDPSDDVLTEYIRRVVETLHAFPGSVIELRALNVPGYGRPHTEAGWFDEPGRLATCALNVGNRGATGVYVTLNPVNPALLARADNHLIKHPLATTSDHDIDKRLWLPLDIDPIRPAGVSATLGEIESARRRAIDVEEWLKTEFDSPELRGFSGNGFHILSRINLPNTDASSHWVQSTINKISDQFSDNLVSIDRAVFNPARIWKLYGSLSRKGDHVPRLGRVHRRSLLIDSFTEFQHDDH